MMTPEKLTVALDAYAIAHPQAQLIDLYKYVLQARYGPGHAVQGPKQVLKSIEQEVPLVRQDGEIVLLGGSDGNYCRIPLSTVSHARIAAQALAEGFYESAIKAPAIEPAALKALWQKCREQLNPETDRDLLKGEKAIAALWQRGKMIPSHSTAYRDAYQPRYRVLLKTIARELLPDAAEF